MENIISCSFFCWISSKMFAVVQRCTKAFCDIKR